MVINCNEQMSAVDRWDVEPLAEIGLSLNHMFHGSQTVIGLPSPKILREKNPGTPGPWSKSFLLDMGF